MKQLSFESAGTKNSMIAFMNRLGRVYQVELINKEPMYFVFAIAVLKFIRRIMGMANAWRSGVRAARQPASYGARSAPKFQ